MGTVPVRTSSQYFISKSATMKVILVFTLFVVALTSAENTDEWVEFEMMDPMEFMAQLAEMSSADCQAALSAVADQHGDMMMEGMESDQSYIMQQFMYYFQQRYWDVLCFYIKYPEKMTEETPNYIY